MNIFNKKKTLYAFLCIYNNAKILGSVDINMDDIINGYGITQEPGFSRVFDCSQVFIFTVLKAMFADADSRIRIPSILYTLMTADFL